jgi:hypothetical protein
VFCRDAAILGVDIPTRNVRQCPVVIEKNIPSWNIWRCMVLIEDDVPLRGFKIVVPA